MKGRPAGSKYFKWGLETRLLLIEILTMVELDKGFKLRTATTADLPPRNKQKWEEVGSRLPTVFDAIDPSRRGSTCCSQFVKLQQRLKLMRLDRRNRYRRANGKPDPIMTDELCWKMAELQETFLQKGHGDHDVAVRNDTQFSTVANQVVALNHERPLLEHGHEEHVPTGNDNQLCTVHPELPPSQVVAVHRGRPLQESCKKGVPENPEMRLSKVVDSNRSGMYRWSEDARLQVIQGVKMMAQNNLSQAGHIKSWREIAASLPKNLFWDIDLDRLANIAKKQFSEMRRRYRIMRDHENSGAGPIRFKTLTKRVLREMATYEEGCLHAQRPRRANRRGANKLCNRKDSDILWVTKTPSQALHAECPGAHGPVLVEIFSRSGKGIENDYFGGRVFEEFDPVYDAYGRDESSIVRNDGEPAEYDESESADRQTSATDSSSEEYKNSESSCRNLLDNEGHYANGWEAQALRTRERREGSYCFEKGSEYLNLQRRQTLSSRATSEAERHSEPHQGNSSDRDVVSECLRRQRGCSSAFSISPADSDPESDHPKIGDHLRNQESNRRGYCHSSANSDSEESMQGRHPHSEGNDEPANEKLDERQEGHLQRQIHWQRGIRPLAADETDSHSDENRRNGNASSDDQSESLHNHSDQVEYDSASTYDESKSHGDHADSVPHFEFRNNVSESGDFVQSDSIDDEFLNGERSKSFVWKTSSPADSHWDESARRGRESSPSDHSQRDHHRARRPCKRAKLKGQFRHRQAIPSSTAKMTDSSGPEHDQSCKVPPVLNNLLKGVDLGFSRLIWWVQHELLPMEREKITNVIKSASIPNTRNKRLRSDAGHAEVVSKCRQNRIRWVLKAELQQVRLKLVEEIDKSSQVVIQEILESLNT